MKFNGNPQNMIQYFPTIKFDSVVLKFKAANWLLKTWKSSWSRNVQTELGRKKGKGGSAERVINYLGYCLEFSFLSCQRHMFRRVGWEKREATLSLLNLLILHKRKAEAFLMDFFASNLKWFDCYFYGIKWIKWMIIQWKLNFTKKRTSKHTWSKSGVGR